ncbi:MAG TPA: GTPase HflX [Fibrobacteria bacterium]|nr:GTPase HflX [Fibrobacteria bacterium]
MSKLKSNSVSKEKAILVGVATRAVTTRMAKEHMAELGRLADTAGAVVVETTMQRRETLDPATLVGEGKVNEIADMVARHQADLVIFDEDLSGSQVKKLETRISCKILDRSGIILDIFAKHARTAEAKVQVEVAQLEYLLPRLTNAWTHLSRQAGGVGIGMKGPGETQLETDKRLVRKRISELTRKLEKMEEIRVAQHNRRIPTFHAALVGYTNAGKSTLMNALTRAGVEAADKLFATLDPTTRKVYLGPKKTAVVSDTVGFIRKLPVGLVSSFKSTLSVVAQATLILHIVDSGAEDFEDQMEITARILEELCPADVPRVTVFNKIDLLEPERLDFLRAHHPQAVFISAEGKLGIDALKERIREFYDQGQFAGSSEEVPIQNIGWGEEPAE